METAEAISTAYVYGIKAPWIIILLYYHYVSGIKWSSDDNNIVYRDYF